MCTNAFTYTHTCLHTHKRTHTHTHTHTFSIPVLASLTEQVNTPATQPGQLARLSWDITLVSQGPPCRRHGEDCGRRECDSVGCLKGGYILTAVQHRWQRPTFVPTFVRALSLAQDNRRGLNQSSVLSFCLFFKNKQTKQKQTKQQQKREREKKKRGMFYSWAGELEKFSCD